MFMNKFSYIIIAFAFCSLTLSPIVSSGADKVDDNGLEEILNRVEEANARLKTMEADIKYSRVISLLDSEEVSNGELKYKKPKKINLNFFPPRNEINVIDGSYVWTASVIAALLASSWTTRTTIASVPPFRKNCCTA